jgi:endonuclease YncB( thermonuclease family)
MNHASRLSLISRGRAPLARWSGVRARVQVLARASVLVLMSGLVPFVQAQWLGTPPFIDAPARPEQEAPFRGRIQHLSDGDSFVVRAEDGRRVPVRLSAIDAPEKNQVHGDVSRRALLALVDEKTLTIVPIKRDPYGRTVAKVMVGEVDVGLEQVRTGMAWHYKRYESEQTARDRRAYAAAEQRAREASVGLWANPDPIPPWRFREQQRRRQGRFVLERFRRGLPAAAA